MALFESPVKTPTNDMRKYFPVFERNGETSPKKSKRNELNFNSEKRPKRESSVGKMRTSGSQTSKRKVRSILFRASDQYALDLGQKDFDANRCKTCHMLFTTGEVVDERTHEEYHDMFVNSLRFNGWKHEDVVAVYEDGRVVRVLAEHKLKHKYMHKKVDELFKVADMELGIHCPLDHCLKHSSVYLLFVTKSKRIGGFVASERITSANRLISEEPLIASTEEEAAECGVARIWTHPRHRRQKIATRLLDALRMSFSFGKVIERSKLAFSDPTLCGKEFAKSYTKRNDFLVFCYQSI